MEFRRNNPQTRDEAQRNRPGALLLCLLNTMKRPLCPAGVQQHASESLAPPGSRSGRGTESLVPYLSQVRNTRPAPLE
jgi:hypothetical protein